jgi:hypothetical protein
VSADVDPARGVEGDEDAGRSRVPQADVVRDGEARLAVVHLEDEVEELVLADRDALGIGRRDLEPRVDPQVVERTDEVAARAGRVEQQIGRPVADLLVQSPIDARGLADPSEPRAQALVLDELGEEQVEQEGRGIVPVIGHLVEDPQREARPERDPLDDAQVALELPDALERGRDVGDGDLDLDRPARHLDGSAAAEGRDDARLVESHNDDHEARAALHLVEPCGVAERVVQAHLGDGPGRRAGIVRGTAVTVVARREQVDVGSHEAARAVVHDRGLDPPCAGLVERRVAAAVARGVVGVRRRESAGDGSTATAGDDEEGDRSERAHHHALATSSFRARMSRARLLAWRGGSSSRAV